MRESGEAKTILFGLTGTGYFDMNAYTSYLSGTMTDYIPTDEDLQRGFDLRRRSIDSDCREPKAPAGKSGRGFFRCYSQLASFNRREAGRRTASTSYRSA